jgi:hypothetical protein
MIEPVTETPPPAGSERPIQFRGRELWVKMPAFEVILVWKRTLAKLESPEAQNWNGEQALQALERARRIIDSFVINRADRDWLDDEMLDPDNPLGLQEAASIIQLTVTEFGGDGEDGAPVNRAARRKATPAKKATRKKATPA